MSDPKQIEVTLTLKDEATKKIQSFRSSIKEFNNTTKDTIAPVLQLRQAWMKAGLAIGFTTAAFALAFKEAEKLRQEIQRLDISAIKLGISSEELSKRLYGFNIGSVNSRLGIAEINAVIENLKNVGRGAVSVGTNILGGMAKWWRASNIGADYLRDTYKEMPWSEAMKLAEKQKLAEAAKRRHDEFLKKGGEEEVQLKIQQLTQSTFDFKQDLFTQELEIYERNGASEIQLEKYKAAFIKRTGQDLNQEYLKQLSVRYKAEGDTMAALKADQQLALQDYIRNWGSNGGAVTAFIQGQQAQLEAARKAWFGIKDQYQITQQAFNGYVSSMENTFSTFIDDGLHGSLRKGSDYFKMWGDEVIKIIAKVIAQMVILNAYSAITGSGKKFGFGDILKSVLGIGGAIGGGMSGGYFSTPSSGGLSTGTYGLGNYALMMHEGGLIKAHSGINLASDEVPIIAQTGERILSRNQNREYEKNKQGNGPIIVIQAWDTQDIMRNRKTIEAIIANALKTNSSLRGTVKTYG